MAVCAKGDAYGGGQGHESPLSRADGGARGSKKELDMWHSVIVSYNSIGAGAHQS